jgi:hypothetical protein
VTRFPNPIGALTHLFTRAFATLAARDGAGRSVLVVGRSHSKMQRSPQASALQAREATAPNGSDINARQNETSDASDRRRFADSRWASIRACESDQTTRAPGNE